MNWIYYMKLYWKIYIVCNSLWEVCHNEMLSFTGEANEGQVLYCKVLTEVDVSGKFVIVC